MYKYTFFLLIMVIGCTNSTQADLIDPTKPPAEFLSSEMESNVVQDSSTLHLNTLLVSPGRKVAIINNEVVGLGETIGGNEVISISADRVTLRTQRGGITELTISRKIRTEK